MPHAYVSCTLLHIKRAKTDAETQNNCPICYNLSRNHKLFNTKARRGAIFISKCTRNCVAAGLHPDSLEELTTLRHRLTPSNWIYAIGPQGRGMVMVRYGRKGKWKGSEGGKRGKGEGRGVVPHPKQKSGCATAGWNERTCFFRRRSFQLSCVAVVRTSCRCSINVRCCVIV